MKTMLFISVVLNFILAFVSGTLAGQVNVLREMLGFRKKKGESE